jgi:hypothetical protein
MSQSLSTKLVRRFYSTRISHRDEPRPCRLSQEGKCLPQTGTPSRRCAHPLVVTKHRVAREMGELLEWHKCVWPTAPWPPEGHRQCVHDSGSGMASTLV